MASAAIRVNLCPEHGLSVSNLELNTSPTAGSYLVSITAVHPQLLIMTVVYSNTNNNTSTTVVVPQYRTDLHQALAQRPDILLMREHTLQSTMQHSALDATRCVLAALPLAGVGTPPANVAVSKTIL